MSFSINDGKVIYKRGNKNKPGSFWRNVHEKNVKEASNFDFLYKDNSTEEKFRQAGDSLLRLGQKERKKELALLKEIGMEIRTDADIKTFIKNFNEILMGAKQFKAASDRLKFALLKENSGKASRAPTISSWFTSYLGTELNQRINKFITVNQKNFINEDFTVWEDGIEKVINEAIDAALEKSLTKVKKVKGKEQYGDSSTWDEVYKAFVELEFADDFRDMIKSKLNFDAIRKMKKNASIIKNKNENKGTRKFVDSTKGLNLGGERRSRTLAGSVQEWVNATLLTMGAIQVNVSGKKSKVLKSEIVKTDSAILFSFDKSIDTQKLVESVIEELDTTLLGSQSLIETSRRMENFYDTKLKNLDKSFIVYSSSKSYSMSTSYKGFHGGGKRNLEDMTEILSRSGSNASSLQDYLHIIYNTGEGAIFESERTEAEEDLKIRLSSAVANLLFDDWNTIGDSYKTGATALHVLSLDGIQLPLSVLLTATGEAMINAGKDINRFVEITTTLPKEILYKEPIKLPINPGHGMSLMREYWNEQAEAARQESTFSLRFLRNFKSEINNYIDF